MKKARELGLELAGSPEIAAMHEAEMAMLRDPAAAAIVREFNETKLRFDHVVTAGRELDAQQKEEAQAIEARAQANPLIARFFDTQRGVEDLLERVNEEIGAGLAGAIAADGCAEEECGDCAGCDR